MLTAHGAAGTEFDTVVVVGAVEGNFPSLSRPEPMFDLAVLERVHDAGASATGPRLADERRLFRVAVSVARGGACVLTASRPAAASRRVGALAVRRGARAPRGSPLPASPAGEPLSVAEAAAAWRRDARATRRRPRRSGSRR